MKHPISILAFLLLPILCFSQGIKFEQGSWKDALALAKQANKPVCLYLYSSKPMDDFLQSETVGNVYNAFFINYKVDMKTQEGSELANKYQVKTQPILLYFNPDGILISQKTISLFAVESTNYTDWARMVLLDVRIPKPITAWEAEYPNKKNDPAFVKEYLDKLRDLNLPFKEVVDQYFRLVLTTDSISVNDAVLFQDVCRNLLVTDFAYRYFFRNRDKYVKVIANYIGRAPDVVDNWAFRSVITNTVNEAVRLKDEALLEKAIKAFRQIPYDPFGTMNVEELYMDYYKRTNDLKKYFAHVKVFCEDKIKMLDSESLLIATNASIKELDKQLVAETDSVKKKRLIQMRKLRIDGERSTICSDLNEKAWFVFLTYSDEAVLKEASKWSEKMVQFSPNTANYLDTHAQLLYKLGRKEEAISFQKRAVANTGGASNASSIEATLKKMEAGEKTR